MTNLKPEICKMMTFSTAHLSSETMNRLMDKDYIASVQAPIYEKIFDGNLIGWFIYIDNSDPKYKHEDLPDDLIKCIAYARQSGCSFICFDSDATIVADLQTYDQ